MPINFDSYLGVHDDALLLFERRNRLLGENIANADTPNYKARDIDFNKVLQGVESDRLQMATTQQGHINLPGDALDQRVKYRIPTQSSADGNTVDTQREKAAYAENTIRYQATMTILSRKLSGLANAFKGE